MSALGRIIMLNDRCRARGGATSIALLATRLLRERGHEVLFISGDDGENPALTEIGVKAIGLGRTALLGGSKLRVLREGIWNNAGAAFLADWIAREGRADDIWHLHNWSQIWSPSVFKGLEAVKDRLIVHAHDYFNACPNGAFWNYQQSKSCHFTPLSGACVTAHCDKRSRVQKFWRLGRQAMLRGAFTGADAPQMLLIHPAMAPALARGGIQAQKMQVLRNPVRPFAQKRILAETNQGLLFVGRLDAEKGALQLARAAALAKAPITFIGEGPEAQAISAACPHAVLTGWQDHSAIRRYAALARALVMPSVYPEPFGLVAVEALGAGLPVLASHTALLAPEITAAGAGWAVDIQNLAGFADILAQITRAPGDQIQAISIAALAAGPQLGLSPQDWVSALEEIYRAKRKAALHPDLSAKGDDLQTRPAA